VEVPIRGQVVAHQLDLEVVFTRDLEEGLTRDLGEVQALALAVDVMAVLVEVARTGGIDLTQIAGEI
jgi:hypothetical protein